MAVFTGFFIPVLGRCLLAFPGFITYRYRHLFKCCLKYLIYPLDRFDFKFFLDVARYLDQILLIFLRYQNYLNTAPMGCQQFFL